MIVDRYPVAVLVEPDLRVHERILTAQLCSGRRAPRQECAADRSKNCCVNTCFESHDRSPRCQSEAIRPAEHDAGHDIGLIDRLVGVGVGVVVDRIGVVVTRTVIGVVAVYGASEVIVSTD